MLIRWKKGVKARNRICVWVIVDALKSAVRDRKGCVQHEGGWMASQLFILLQVDIA